MISSITAARPLAMALTLGSSLIASTMALSADLTIAVTGIERDAGEIGCALYAGADGFPLDPSKATRQWHDARRQGVECRFEGLAAGTYAVAISHDFNGNRETDTDFFGIPDEPWGVSNNVRPFLRAPTFEEAAVRLGQDEPLRIQVEVAE